MNNADQRTTSSQADRSVEATQNTDLPSAIGGYHILKRIGSGGMGDVFLARSRQPGARRAVAIKVLRRANLGDEAESRSRFALEMNILAAMEHPCIARWLDGGRTEDDHLFVVMEFVEGKTLSDHCDAECLSIAARIDIFKRICAATQYLHGEGVLHCDLKPGNIIVTPDGDPKLLDLGVATLIHDRMAPVFVGPASQRERAGTLLYASPEQVSGGRLTPRSDVFSLGVVLYELLTGYTPYDSAPSDLAEVGGQRHLVEVYDAIAPSELLSPKSTFQQASEVERLQTIAKMRSTTAKNLSRRLFPDLDAVVLRALAKDPKERYDGPSELIADLDAWREHRPLRAMDAAAPYRLRKYLRRNRPGVAAILVTLALCGIVVGGVLAQARAFIYEDMVRAAHADARVSQLKAEAMAAGQSSIKQQLQVLGHVAEQLGHDLGDEATADEHLQLRHVGTVVEMAALHYSIRGPSRGDVGAAQEQLLSALTLCSQYFSGRSGPRFDEIRARVHLQLGDCYMESASDSDRAMSNYRSAMNFTNDTMRRSYADLSLVDVLSKRGQLEAVEVAGEYERILKERSEWNSADRRAVSVARFKYGVQLGKVARSENSQDSSFEALRILELALQERQAWMSETGEETAGRVRAARQTWAAHVAIAELLTSWPRGASEFRAERLRETKLHLEKGLNLLESNDGGLEDDARRFEDMATTYLNASEVDAELEMLDEARDALVAARGLLRRLDAISPESASVVRGYIDQLLAKYPSIGRQKDDE